MTQAATLVVTDVTVRFGGIVALDRVSFDTEPRQIVGLIGPNGAGKTTLFNCLSRLYTASAGTVSFEGAPLLTHPAHRIAGLGIGRTFQNLALFPTQSVLQNVMVGAHCRTSSDFLSNALKLGWVAREEAGCRAYAEELLEFLDLGPVAHHPAAGLPFATLKRVELAARAGYDPRAAIALWQKMAKLSGGGAPPALLSTHPSNEARIKDLEVFSQRVLPLYEQARAAK